MKSFGFLIIGLMVQAQTPAKAPPLDFPATCSAPAHQRFIQGVIQLHNSAYPEAATHFRVAEQIDPKCVMAFWGEAMTFNHPFWAQQDKAGGRAVLTRLGSTKAATARERGYINAVTILYGEGDDAARNTRYADAMSKLSADNPTDLEAAAFYAAAILGAIDPLDKDSSKQRLAAAALAKKVLLKYPNHPGGLHYLIHAYDTPELAPQALDAARHYEKIAEGSHALHMPSHIYLQLGMWSDVARSNDAAFRASATGTHGDHDPHSLQWLQYAEIQLGQLEKAKSRTETVLKFADLSADIHIKGHMTGEAAEMASRYVVETGDWPALAKFLIKNVTPKLLFAQGLEALSKRDMATAKDKVANLEGLIQVYRASTEKIRPLQTDVLKRELSAKIAVVEKRSADAERFASEAVQIEAMVPVPSIMEQGGILKPATEFYGEILIETGKPALAAEQFSATLKRMPKRAGALLGLARARAAQKDIAGASQAYKELATIWTNADPSVAAVKEVRAWVAAHP